jgi:hypothetical protein
MLHTKVGPPLTLRRLRKQRLRREKALGASPWKSFVRGSRTTVKQISARALIKPYVLFLGLVIMVLILSIEKKTEGVLVFSPLCV